MKFKGQISQGLVQPLSILPEGNYGLGDDVTELLGIRKWKIEEFKAVKGYYISTKMGGTSVTMYW